VSQLTTNDLDQIGTTAFTAPDPLAVAAELIDAVDQNRVADKADLGHALLLAAEIHERANDLDAALALAERAVEANRAHGKHPGHPQSFKAGLLLRLGREDEGLAELARLRPLLTQDPVAVDYLSEALESGGHADIAEQWLGTALETVLDRRDSSTEDDDVAGTVLLAYTLTQQRHRIRRDLDLPHDEHDHLADRLRTALDRKSPPQRHHGAGDLAALFWPRVEFDRLLLRWPVFAETYGRSWDEYRDSIEHNLQLSSRSGLTGLTVNAGTVDGLAAFASRRGADVTDPDLREDYAQSLPERPWPPGRNEACWCGSGLKYKKCCLARSRAR
jgi:tetratricopeptide (TPR) repeat protein